MIPASIYELMRHARFTTLACAIAGAFLLPLTGAQQKGLAKFTSAGLGAMLAIAGSMSNRDWQKLLAVCEDMEAVDRQQHVASYSQALQQPLLPPTATANATIDIQPLQDVVSYWISEDKHLLVVGGTGSGKSTFIQAFANKLSSDWFFRLYDTDCTIDDWSYIRTRAHTLYETLEDIEADMERGLTELEERMKERKKLGNRWEGLHTFIVGEEFPFLASDIKKATVWMPKFAKRGRRVKLFMALLAQNDTVANLGLKGDSKLRDSCFVRVYLGNEAVERAKLMKNPALVDWLKAGGKNVCLVDDMPAMRPSY